MDNYDDRFRIKELPPLQEGGMITEFDQLGQSARWWEKQDVNKEKVYNNIKYRKKSKISNLIKAS